MLLILTLLIAFFALTYRGAGAKTCTLTFGLILAGFTFWSHTSPVLLTLLWLVFAGYAVFAHAGKLRRKRVMEPLLRWFKSLMPPISQTEREALEAGTVGWEGELFSGRPKWRRLLNLSTTPLSEEEQAFIDGPVKTLCQRLDDWKITHEQYDLPEEIWQFIKREGFFGMIIPKAYGGLEFSARAHSTVVMKISTRSISAGVSVMVPNSLGPAELLLHYGTDEQKDYYLPRLAKGEEIPCFALTSDKAGSDAGAMEDKGIVCRGQWEGRETLGLKLTWNKRYITLAPVATVLGLAFKVYDPDHLLGEEESLGVTCALIPTHLPGVNIGRRHLPMDAVFMNGPTSGEEVFVPLDYVIGGPEYIGHGWAMLMTCLSVGRGISLPAQSTGAGKLCTLTTGAYARLRQQFDRPIGTFEGIEEALAEIAGRTYIMDSGRLFTAAAVDRGEKPAIASAILKYHNTENMRVAVGFAMDVHSGRGVIKGPRNYIAPIYQSIPISITVEGANILTRSLMIYGQGAIRCHPFLLKEMELAQAPDTEEALKDFDKTLLSHIQRALQAFSRTWVMGLSGAAFAPAPDVSKLERYYYRHLSRYAAAFYLLSDLMLMQLGGALKTREKISGRMGDILSYLYLGSAVLKKFNDDHHPKEDIPLLRWSMEHLLYLIQQALDENLHNFPTPWLGKVMRWVVFPFGRTQQKPDDALEHKVTALILDRTAARERLVRHAYFNTDPEDPVGRIENAFQHTLRVAPMQERIYKAQKEGRLEKHMSGKALYGAAVRTGIISEEAFEQLITADRYVEDAIQVDAFDQRELSE